MTKIQNRNRNRNRNNERMTDEYKELKLMIGIIISVNVCWWFAKKNSLLVVLLNVCLFVCLVCVCVFFCMVLSEVWIKNFFFLLVVSFFFCLPSLCCCCCCFTFDAHFIPTQNLSLFTFWVLKDWTAFIPPCNWTEWCNNS